MFHRRWKQVLAVTLVSFTLAGCGGGGGGRGGGAGGGGGAPPPPPPPPTFTVGGSISGLVGSLTLQNTDGVPFTVSANGPFTFAGTVASGASYSVTVTAQPELQTCTVANGSGAASANVTNIAVTCADPVPPTLSLSPQAIKTFRFVWDAVPGVTRYKLLEDETGSSGFTQAGADLTASTTSINHIVPLYRRVNARYKVQACAATRCIDSNIVTASGSLAEAVGYFKAESITELDQFGTSVALSADGTTLAVGVPFDDSNSNGVDGDPDDEGNDDSGAVYVFVRDGAGPTWEQQAFIKASNTGPDDNFGADLALSADGSTLAVAARNEDSDATGVNGNQGDNFQFSNSGAVYVYERSNGSWENPAYLKASNTQLADLFGVSLALSGDGRTLAVGAPGEDSIASGVDGSEGDNTASNAGAVYVFVKEGLAWRQDAYVKASNTDNDDQFGTAVALSSNGATLAVGARLEDSEATGVGGQEFDEGATDSGAVYVFTRTAQWEQQAYIKASNTGLGDLFGEVVALSADGSTLAVGASFEDSAATGIDGDERDDTASAAGAAYVFVRTGTEGTEWEQQAYVKASNTGAPDIFGRSLALSIDGSILAVGAPLEGSSAIGIGGEDSDDSIFGVGAVYVFERSNDAWGQRAYVKPSNTSTTAYAFSFAVALSADGATLAVGATGEPGSDPGINRDQTSPPIRSAGAVYLY